MIIYMRINNAGMISRLASSESIINYHVNDKFRAVTPRAYRLATSAPGRRLCFSIPSERAIVGELAREIHPCSLSFFLAAYRPSIVVSIGRIFSPRINVSFACK